MDTSLLGNVKEIGIALVAVIGSGVLLKFYMDRTGKFITDLLAQLQDNRKDYTGFVESNNHLNSERIEASTKVMTEVASALEQHNRILEKLVDRLGR